MNLNPLRLIPVVCVLLSGCASDNLAKFYEPYQGAQKPWPTDPSGGFISVVDGVTFYHGRPPQSYQILGRYDRPHISPSRVASSAKYHHADAVMLLERDVEVNELDRGVTFGNNRVEVATPSTIRHTTQIEGTAYLIAFINPTNAP